MGVGGLALASQELLPTYHELIGAGAKAPSSANALGFGAKPPI